LWTDYENRRADFVRASAQSPQNHARLIQITRFAYDFAFECDKRVRREHDPMRVDTGEGQSFAGGIRDCYLAQG
jgi:hypothetical protein